MRQESDSPIPHQIFMADKPIINNSKIPSYVTHVTETLKNAGFESFLVGGCVRDLILNKEPKDWDITTNAKPEEIIALFEKTVYENTFGTVGVFILDVSHETKEDVTRVTNNDVNPADGLPVAGRHETDRDVTRETPQYNIVEVTPYRIEAKYSDFRHPDKVKFSENVEDDLKRRDFTINAMAYDSDKGHLMDLFDGIKDIKDKVIRAVGKPSDRFNEDALRMLRAIRFSTQLNFVIEYDTMQAIVDNSHLLKNISEERIRDEFIKIIESKNSAMGIGMLSKLGLLKYIIPELEEGIGCVQGGAHTLDVFEHLLKALEYASDKNFSIEIRLAALFHDIGKPRSRRNNAGFIEPETNLSGPRISSLIARPDHAKLVSGSKNLKKKYTFYGHEVVGAKMTQKILDRLKFPKKISDLVVSMIRNHMFFSDTEQITLSAVRRIVQKVGPSDAKALAGRKENYPIWDLMKVRECDRAGMKKSESPYRLRKYYAMIEEVLHDPISVGQLAIDGEVLIGELHMKPSPRMGWILHALLEVVLDDPTKNDKGHLMDIAKSLDLLGDNELKALGERGKEEKEKLEQEEIKRLHEKHGV